MGGRDHSCDVCGLGGFNGGDCECPPQWTDEQVFAQWMLEVRLRFLRENAQWHADGDRDLARMAADDVAALVSSGYDVNRNSFFFEIYEGIAFSHEANLARALLPRGFAIYSDLVAMFASSSVAWGFPCVLAVLVDGEPRLQIEVVLVEYWTDVRAKSWLHEREFDATG